MSIDKRIEEISKTLAARYVTAADKDRNVRDAMAGTALNTAEYLRRHGASQKSQDAALDRANDHMHVALKRKAGMRKAEKRLAEEGVKVLTPDSSDWADHFNRMAKAAHASKAKELGARISKDVLAKVHSPRMMDTAKQDLDGNYRHAFKQHPLFNEYQRHYNAAVKEEVEDITEVTREQAQGIIDDAERHLHANHGSGHSNGRVGLEDAKANMARGDHEHAASRAHNSMLYTVGAFHPDAIKANKITHLIKEGEEPVTEEQIDEISAGVKQKYTAATSQRISDIYNKSRQWDTDLLPKSAKDLKKHTAGMKRALSVKEMVREGLEYVDEQPLIEFVLSDGFYQLTEEEYNELSEQEQALYEVAWKYRSGIGHGTIVGVVKKGVDRAHTEYKLKVSKSDLAKHKGEPEFRNHYGSDFVHEMYDEGNDVTYVSWNLSEEEFEEVEMELDELSSATLNSYVDKSNTHRNELYNRSEILKRHLTEPGHDYDDRASMRKERTALAKKEAKRSNGTSMAFRSHDGKMFREDEFAEVEDTLNELSTKTLMNYRQKSLDRAENITDQERKLRAARARHSKGYSLASKKVIDRDKSLQKEEVIDELSTNTLNRYSTAARMDRAKKIAHAERDVKTKRELEQMKSEHPASDGPTFDKHIGNMKRTIAVQRATYRKRSANINKADGIVSKRNDEAAAKRGHTIGKFQWE